MKYINYFIIFNYLNVSVMIDEYLSDIVRCFHKHILNVGIYNVYKYYYVILNANADLAEFYPYMISGSFHNDIFYPQYFVANDFVCMNSNALYLIDNMISFFTPI